MNSVRYLRIALDNVSEGVICIDRQGTVRLFNTAAQRMFGYPENEVIGKNIDALIPALRLGQPGEPLREMQGLRRNGTAFQVDLNICEARDRQESMCVYVVRDVTERQQAEQRLLQLAHYDALTGLPTRALFQDRARHALARADRDDKLAAILYLDIDYFKQINDGLGHHAGDELLMGVARRITSCLREVDTVSRLGGDEFAVVLENIVHVDNATIVAQKILDVMREPFRLDGHEVSITLSIGITLYPMDDKDLNHLLKDADAAMYRAKQAGRNGYQLFGTDMTEGAADAQRLERQVEHAFENGEFLLHYQPRVDLLTGKVSGVEALLRWNHPESSLMTAESFMPLLAKTKHIYAVDEWVLRTACAQNRRWQEEGLPCLRMTVNISPARFRRSGLVELVATIIKESGLGPDFLELDVPAEDMVGMSREHYHATLKGFRALGVHVALTDYGADNPLIEVLRRFPLDIIKIDRAFVRNATVDRDQAAIVQAIVTLARALKLKVVAAGVETQEQLELLRDCGCDSIQGFFYSRPVPEAEVTQLLREGRQLA